MGITKVEAVPTKATAVCKVVTTGITMTTAMTMTMTMTTAAMVVMEAMEATADSQSSPIRRVFRAK